jgi:Flp pilus assembly pilin Flp
MFGRNSQTEMTSMVAKLIDAVKTFITRNEGTSLVEYAVVLVLIAVICLTAIAQFGSAISTMLMNAAGSI